MKKFIALLMVLVLSVSLCACSSSSSKSDREWSDLEDWEKDNARWAYEAQQAIEEY